MKTLSEIIAQYSAGYSVGDPIRVAIAAADSDQGQLERLLFHGICERAYDPSLSKSDRNLEIRELKRGFARDLAPHLPLLMKILDKAPESLGSPDLEMTHEWNLIVEALCEVLGIMGEGAEEAIGALIGLMRIQPRGVGLGAASALGRIGGDRSILELNKVWFSGWDRKLCGACYAALERLRNRAFPTLLNELNQEESLRRNRALRSLEVTGYSIHALRALAEKTAESDSDLEVKAAALEIHERCVGEPLYPFGEFKWSVDAARGSPFFRRLDLKPTEYANEYRPERSICGKSFSIVLKSDPDSHLIGVNLYLLRNYVNGPQGVYAIDIATSFLRSCLNASDQASLGTTLDQLEKLLNRGQVDGFQDDLLAAILGHRDSAAIELDSGLWLTIADKVGISGKERILGVSVEKK